jgi:dihydroneopterin aldolase
MTTSQPYSRITLQRLELDAFLGWPAAERAVLQPVSIDVTLRFPLPPKGCVTDDLQDTHCYATLVEKIRATVAEQPYRLLENLGYAIYHTVKAAVATAHVAVDIKKLPPIPNLAGGVTFSIGD